VTSIRWTPGLGMARIRSCERSLSFFRHHLSAKPRRPDPGEGFELTMKIRRGAGRSAELNRLSV
jgi:hypothetical protein